MSTKNLSNDPDQQWEVTTNFAQDNESSIYLNQISVEPVIGAEKDNPFKILISINDDDYSTVVNLPITIEDAEILRDWFEAAIYKARAIEDKQKGGNQ